MVQILEIPALPQISQQSVPEAHPAAPAEVTNQDSPQPPPVAAPTETALAEVVPQSVAEQSPPVMPTVTPEAVAKPPDALPSTTIEPAALRKAPQAFRQASPPRRQILAAKDNRLSVAAVAPARSDARGDAPRESSAIETLKSRIRDAVQAAVRCPAAARMMGQSGKAGVAFDYHDGAMIGGAALARTSGTPMLDAAALSAVRDAHYPAAPPDASGQVLHLLIWVEEACGG